MKQMSGTQTLQIRLDSDTFLMDTSFLTEFEECFLQTKKDVEKWRILAAESLQKYEKAKKSMADSDEARLQKAKMNEARFEERILFDVGGTLFPTTKQTLLSKKDTYFSAMLQSGYWEPSEDGIYFIDRNPKFFGYILDYLRYGVLDTVGLNCNQIKMLQLDLQHFCIDLKLPVNLCTDYMKPLRTWLGQSFDASNLLWRGTTHGLTATEFHTRCDNKGATLTVIESTDGWLFGCYNPTSWTFGLHNGDFAKEDYVTAFLFILKSPGMNNNTPTQYLARNQKPIFMAMSHSKYGPTFGSSYNDFCLAVFSQNGTSYTRSPLIYSFQGGKKEFEIKEIEVYAV